jgi:lipid-binding SYLF domain-containing protein
MRMFSLGGGFGMGVKDFRVVFIFHTQAAFDNFLSAGWDFAAQTDAAAKAGEGGDTAEAAGTIVDGVSLYQFTENGLALQATLQGTKYYKDNDLN